MTLFVDSGARRAHLAVEGRCEAKPTTTWARNERMAWVATRSGRIRLGVALVVLFDFPF